MAKKTEDSSPAPTAVEVTTLAEALVHAINSTKAKEKSTAANRVKNTPWTPKNGEPRSKMRRKYFHHALPLGTRTSNQEIDLLNKVKPGTYCDGWVRVVRRKDKGIDVDYPVKTTAQRLKLVNQFGIRNFAELLQRIVDEGANPATYKNEEDD